MVFVICYTNWRTLLYPTSSVKVAGGNYYCRGRVVSATKTVSSSDYSLYSLLKSFSTLSEAEVRLVRTRSMPCLVMMYSRPSVVRGCP